MDITCEPTGKQVYATQYHAEQALDELRHKFGDGKHGIYTLMPYHCHDCGFWHLGRPWRKQREQADRRRHRQEYMT